MASSAAMVGFAQGLQGSLQQGMQRYKAQTQKQDTQENRDYKRAQTELLNQQVAKGREYVGMGGQTAELKLQLEKTQKELSTMRENNQHNSKLLFGRGMKEASKDGKFKAFQYQINSNPALAKQVTSGGKGVRKISYSELYPMDLDAKTRSLQTAVSAGYTEEEYEAGYRKHHGLPEKQIVKGFVGVRDLAGDQPVRRDAEVEGPMREIDAETFKHRFLEFQFTDGEGNDITAMYDSMQGMLKSGQTKMMEDAEKRSYTNIMDLSTPYDKKAAREGAPTQDKTFEEMTYGEKRRHTEESKLRLERAAAVAKEREASGLVGPRGKPTKAQFEAGMNIASLKSVTDFRNMMETDENYVPDLEAFGKLSSDASYLKDKASGEAVKADMATRVLNKTDFYDEHKPINELSALQREAVKHLQKQEIAKLNTQDQALLRAVGGASPLVNAVTGLTKEDVGMIDSQIEKVKATVKGTKSKEAIIALRQLNTLQRKLYAGVAVTPSELKLNIEAFGSEGDKLAPLLMKVALATESTAARLDGLYQTAPAYMHLKVGEKYAAIRGNVQKLKNLSHRAALQARNIPIDQAIKEANEKYPLITEPEMQTQPEVVTTVQETKAVKEEAQKQELSTSNYFQ